MLLIKASFCRHWIMDVIYGRVAFRQKYAITPKIYCTFTVHAVGTTDFGLISTWGVINNMKYDVYIQHDMMLEAVA